MPGSTGTSSRIFGIRSTASGAGPGSRDTLSQALTRTGDHGDRSGVAGCAASTWSASKRSKSWRVRVAIPISDETQTASPARPTTQLTPSASVRSQRRAVDTADQSQRHLSCRSRTGRTAGISLSNFTDAIGAMTMRCRSASNMLEGVPKCPGERGYSRRCSTLRDVFGAQRARARSSAPSRRGRAVTVFRQHVYCRL